MERALLPGPTREATLLPSGDFLLTITPPEWSGFRRSNSLTLTADQYHRFCQWLETGVMIQDVLPDLSADQRELLLSGIGIVDWDNEFGDDHD